MAGVAKKSFESPDERRAPDKTEVDVVELGSVKAARMTLQPGWRWSECIKPVAGTESCQIHHVGTATAGQLRVRHDDGTELEVGPATRMSSNRATTRGWSVPSRSSVTSSTAPRRSPTPGAEQASVRRDGSAEPSAVEKCVRRRASCSPGANGYEPGIPARSETTDVQLLPHSSQ